jgi:hypothetical protein
MARRKQQGNKRQQKAAVVRQPVTRTLSALSAPPTPEAKKEYGQPFILLEDESLCTFHYQGGAWVPYEKNIAECRLDCKVQLLAQKVNKMNRYEIRPQIHQTS